MLVYVTDILGIAPAFNNEWYQPCTTNVSCSFSCCSALSATSQDYDKEHQTLRGSIALATDPHSGSPY